MKKGMIYIKNGCLLRFLPLLSLLLPAACNLDYAPENVLVNEIVYRDEGASEGALIGAYVRLNSFVAGAPNDQNNYANTGYPYMLGDVGTANVSVRSSASTYLAMENSIYTATDHDNVLYPVWKSGYNAVDYANNVIDGISRYGTYTQALRQQHIAEAKFIRAYTYFVLLQLFGDGALTGNDDAPGLVLRLKPYDGYNPEQIQVRATVSEIYRQLVNDLSAALPHLPSGAFAPNLRYRASKTTAQALLSRIYLYKGSYKNDRTALDSAAFYAGEVLRSGDYTFSDDCNEYLSRLFPPNTYSASSYPDPQDYSNEVIFFQPSRFSTAKYANGLLSYSKNYYYADTSFVKTYGSGDVRGYAPIPGTSLTGHGDPNAYPSDLTTMKYSNDRGYDDVIYIRLAEIKLTRAESLARIHREITPEALQHLNDIRRRPFPEADKPRVFTLSDFASVSHFIDEVLKERNLELAFEGHYRWDLIRTGRPLKNVSLPDNRKILPLPDFEIRISDGKIVQNSGYR
jgi:hypothetical protein